MCVLTCETFYSNHRTGISGQAYFEKKPSAWLLKVLIRFICLYSSSCYMSQCFNSNKSDNFCKIVFKNVWKFYRKHKTTLRGANSIYVPFPSLSTRRNENSRSILRRTACSHPESWIKAAKGIQDSMLICRQKWCDVYTATKSQHTCTRSFSQGALQVC